MNKKMLMIILPVLLVAVGAALYFFVFSGGEPKAEYDMYSPGDFFVTNIGGGSYRLVKAGIVLELDSKSIQAQLADKNTLIRDTIIFVLREYTEEDYRRDDIQQVLRQRISEALNEKLEITHITGVLFNDFVIQ